MGLPSLGERALLASLPGGICRRDQAQAFHPCSRGITTGEVASCGDHGDGHRALHPTESLQGFDHRVQTPGLDVLVAFLGETLEAFRVCSDRPDICLEHDVLRRGRADALREPPERGWAPMGLARGAAIVSAQEGFAATCGVLESAEGLFTGPRQVPDGVIFHLGDRDRGAISRASEAGQWQGVSTVCFDPITGLLGHEGGSHDPAVIVFLPQIPLEPGATRASLIDKEEVCGFRWHLADALIDVALTCPNGSQVRHLSAMVLGDIRHGNSIFVDIHSNEECARLRHG